MTADPRRLAYWLLKDMNRAVREFDMIHNGDRVAVAVSGGKDSLSLLRLLDLWREQSRERYELIAVHIPADSRGPATLSHPPLLNWLAASGIPYHIQQVCLPEDEVLPMGCQRCAWNRRKALFEAARGLGCSVVALGHHADDLAQTTLLNLLNHGRVETMAPRRDYFDGALRLVRPLCYVQEASLHRFARACAFPPPPPACPQSGHSHRELAKQILAQAEKGCRSARVNLLRAGLRGNSAHDQIA